MTSWLNRVFAVVSILWGLLVLGALAFAWIARDYMLSEEAGWPRALLESGIIIGASTAIWFGAYRLMQWFEERS